MMLKMQFLLAELIICCRR